MYNSRKRRGQTQRLYLLECKYDGGAWAFQVKGLTNTYDLVINSNFMSCSCQDFATRRRVCKHLYFIISRIAQNNAIANQLEANDGQRASSQYPFLGDAHMKTLTDNLLLRLRSRIQSIPDEKPVNKKVKIEDVDCPICYEEIDTSKEKISQCEKQCKKYFHQECLLLWLDTNLSCPMCRVAMLKKEFDPNYAGIVNSSSSDDPMSLLKIKNLSGIL